MMTTKQKGISGLMTGVVGIVGVLLLGGSALAGAFVHGTICQADGGATGYGVNLGGATNNSTSASLSLFCPSPIDHDVGASLQWQAQVEDTSTTGEVRCQGAAMDSSGNQIGTTATVGTGNAFVGSTLLSYSFTASVGAATYSYVSQCTLPAKPSSVAGSLIRYIRVF